MRGAMKSLAMSFFKMAHNGKILAKAGNRSTTADVSTKVKYQ